MSRTPTVGVAGPPPVTGPAPPPPAKRRIAVLIAVTLALVLLAAVVVVLRRPARARNRPRVSRRLPSATYSGGDMSVHRASDAEWADRLADLTTVDERRVRGRLRSARRIQDAAKRDLVLA